mgnify:FL=1
MSSWNADDAQRSRQSVATRRVREALRLRFLVVQHQKDPAPRESNDVKRDHPPSQNTVVNAVRARKFCPGSPGTRRGGSEQVPNTSATSCSKDGRMCTRTDLTGEPLADLALALPSLDSATQADGHGASLSGKVSTSFVAAHRDGANWLDGRRGRRRGREPGRDRQAGPAASAS